MKQFNFTYSQLLQWLHDIDHTCILINNYRNIDWYVRSFDLPAIEQQRTKRFCFIAVTRRRNSFYNGLQDFLYIQSGFGWDLHQKIGKLCAIQKRIIGNNNLNVTLKMSSHSNSNRFFIWIATPSGLAFFKSILFNTGKTVKFWEKAKKKLATVCAWTPWFASTSRITPWHAAKDRDTSNLW